MVSITLSVSEEVRRLMKKFPEINWSALVRKTIEEKAKQLVLKERLIKEMDNEAEFNDWAVKLIRRGRNNENSS